MPTSTASTKLAGMRLIQEFESFEPHAYADPLHGWDVPTIGYGTTVYVNGERVKRGDTITKTQAEKELKDWLNTKIAPKLEKIPDFKKMHPLMVGALQSFAFNLGAGFYGNRGFSTISKKLREKDYSTMRAAFVLYRNPGSNVEAGLLRRRRAEASMWEDGLAELNKKSSGDKAVEGERWDTERLTKLVLGFRSENPNHVKSLEELASLLPDDAFSEKSKWVKAFRKPLAAPTKEEKDAGFALPVQYFSQRDSRRAGQAHRMCFSSSCAMVLDFLKPGVIHGPNGDDEYLGRVLRYGDTTESPAQVAALNSYGVSASFSTRLNWSDVNKQLNKGIPVPIGILHHGHVSSPRGGGHWIVIIGRTADKKGYWVHDPYGDLNLVNGGHVNTSGKKLRYSIKNLEPRWMVEGDKTGWGILAKK